MTLQEIADQIEIEEMVFLNDDGFLDKSFIMERFNLNAEQYKQILKLLGE